MSQAWSRKYRRTSPVIVGRRERAERRTDGRVEAEDRLHQPEAGDLEDVLVVVAVRLVAARRGSREREVKITTSRSTAALRSACVGGVVAQAEQLGGELGAFGVSVLVETGGDGGNGDSHVSLRTTRRTEWRAAWPLAQNQITNGRPTQVRSTLERTCQS